MHGLAHINEVHYGPSLLNDGCRKAKGPNGSFLNFILNLDK
jgi:hypothetical protein